MRRDGELDERFAAYVRERGEHHLRMAVLLTGDWHAAEDLIQASLVKLYRAWPRLQIGPGTDTCLRRIMINTHRSWWRARWRRETPVAVLRSATDVRQAGPASGPGWTGSAYTFTIAATLNGRAARQPDVHSSGLVT